jgi:hypothetical protein
MSPAASHSDPAPQLLSQSNTNLNDFALPACLSRDAAIPCMIFAPFLRGARQALTEVQQDAKKWFGEHGLREDAGGINRSIILFLPPTQVKELKDRIKETRLEVYTVEDFSKSVERGIRGEAPYVDSETFAGDMTREQCGINAGHAMAELSTNKDLPSEKQRSLTNDILNGMAQLQDFGESILKSVLTEIDVVLIERATAAQNLSEDVGILDIDEAGIYVEAGRLTDEYARTSPNLREVQEALLPLARALLELPSPILKEVVYSQIEKNNHLLGYGLGLYGSDPQPMLDALDNWQAFWDSQVPLLSRYFIETAAEQAAQKAAETTRTKTENVDERESGGEIPPSAWSCSVYSKGNKAVLSPSKWNETVFHEIRNEDTWGMSLMGVPGPIGDRAYQIISKVMESANAEAMACRPAYGQLLVERHLVMGNYPDPESVPEQFRKSYEHQRHKAIEGELEKAGRLVHGVTDIILSNLPWQLPRKETPLPIDSVLYLERTLTLLERSLKEDATGPGLRYTAELASQELFIQFINWPHIKVLDDNPELAKRCRKLFDDVKGQLPDEWISKLPPLFSQEG